MHIPALAQTRRLATVVLAAVGLVVTAAATPALAAGTTQNTSAPPSYLALGDSIPFGFHNVTDLTQYLDQSKFRGYPELLAQETHLRLTNASCPGETSTSFINPRQGVYKCEGPAGYRTNFPLHVQYAHSQLAFAIHYLRTTPNVRLVTLQLGANDVFLCQAENPGDNCTSPAEILPVLARVNANIRGIVAALRTQGHYNGQIVVVDYYALNYADPTGTQGTVALDQAIDTAARASGACVASGFLAYAPIALLKGHGDTRAAGLVRPAPDVHPTRFGQEVLEDAVQVVVRH